MQVCLEKSAVSFHISAISEEERLAEFKALFRVSYDYECHQELQEESLLHLDNISVDRWVLPRERLTSPIDDRLLSLVVNSAEIEVILSDRLHAAHPSSLRSHGAFDVNSSGHACECCLLFIILCFQLFKSPLRLRIQALSLTSSSAYKHDRGLQGRPSHLSSGYIAISCKVRSGNSSHVCSRLIYRFHGF